MKKYILSVMKPHSLIKLPCFLFVLLALAPSLFAGLALESYTKTGVAGSNYGPGSRGFQFTVGASAIEVTQLGVFDNSADGFWNQLNITIYLNSTGATVSTASVSNVIGHDSTLVISGDTFRFANVTPVTLLANTSYVLAADVTSLGNPDNDLLYDQSLISAVTAGPGITINEGRYGGAFEMPTGSAGLAYVGPDMTYTVVPEPSTFFLVVGAVAVLCFVRRRRWES